MELPRNSKYIAGSVEGHVLFGVLSFDGWYGDGVLLSALCCRRSVLCVTPHERTAISLRTVQLYCRSSCKFQVCRWISRAELEHKVFW